MREIKFRAWHKELNSLISWELVCQHHDLCELIASRHPVEQFTGLKDKNNVEIYDGDILSFSGIGNRPVVFVKGAFGYNPFTAKFLDDEFISFAKIHGISKKIEVIGNIHENPELLEG